MRMAMLLAGGMMLVINATHAFAVEPPAAPKSAPQPLRSQPRELGTVSCARDLDLVLTQAKRKNTPVMVIFTEVPGCKTCVSYGQLVLSHPLIAEAIETLFVPVAIYNNAKGVDAEVLKSFDEPPMNNPVVRIIDADRKPLAARVHDDYTPAGLVAAMTTALDKTNAKTPGYLKLLHEELTARAVAPQRAVFAMHCFWEGEAKLGGLTGVIETRPGFVQGREVVEVMFDPTKLSYETLVKNAVELKCADKVFTQDATQQSIATKAAGAKAVRSDEKLKPDDQPKYNMAATLYRFVPMTLTQACRVNAAIAQGKPPAQYLSPRQLELYAKIEANPKLKWQAAAGTGNLAHAWGAAQKVAASK